LRRTAWSLAFKETWALFEDDKFDHYAFEEIPLKQDLYLMDEKYLVEYDAMMSSFLKSPDLHEYSHVGDVSFVSGRKVLNDSIELSWYANVSDRFHEISVILPKDQFVYCISCWQYDEKPIIFVKSSWLQNLYLRSYSVFVMIDAIGVKKCLDQDKLTQEMLSSLRDKIDELAENYQEVSFVSFADSLLLKSNWSVGTFDSNIDYTYQPEVFISLASEICNIYKSCLGLPTYAVITQGNNAYYDDPLLHISKSENHISLNSLGIPFAQLMDIDKMVRENIRAKNHDPADIYMDSQYYNSLKFKCSFEKQEQPKADYQTKMVSQPCAYYFNSTDMILSNLEK